MGQQQLILLVLVFIIVGIASVVAINTFQESKNSAAKDAARIDMLNAISSAQKYYLAPTSMGGGDKSFTGITFKDISIDSVNENTSYSLTASNGSFEITAVNSVYDINFKATATVSGSSKPVVVWQDL